MNVDAQFMPTALAGAPHRPAQRPADQETTRPVDRPHHNEATGKQTGQESGQVAERKPADQQPPADKNPGQNAELSADEQRELEQLQARDREVRAHEKAHKNAAGHHARGGASFEHETGPDGKRYAVSGEVSIDVSKVDGNPQATIAKAQTIRGAALAPAQPSGQDFAVAAKASRMEAEARAELAEHENGDSSATNTAPSRGGFDTNPTQPASVGELLDVVA
jgi:SprA-related family